LIKHSEEEKRMFDPNKALTSLAQTIGNWVVENINPTYLLGVLFVCLMICLVGHLLGWDEK
jgi:hypothetical protein